MVTNLALDAKLIDEAKRIGGHATRKEAVTAALDEYIRRRKQLEVIKLFGTIDYDPDHEPLKLRQRDRERMRRK